MSHLHTPLCRLLGIEHPVIQAGMGWDAEGSTTPPELVAAVSNAGALGVIGGSPLHPDFLRERIRATRALTDRPFGVDITLPRLEPRGDRAVQEMEALIDRDHPGQAAFVDSFMGSHGLRPTEPGPRQWVKTPELMARQLEVIFSEGVPVLAVGLGTGLTRDMVGEAHRRGIRVLTLVGSARQALGHAELGVDAIIAQGYEAGGHTGRVANFILVPEVVDAVAPLPVVAAGGIADGRAVAAALSLGAVGVWCGTVFLLAEECRIHAAYREQLVRGTTADFVVDRFLSGKPSRHFRSELIRAWEASGLPSLDMPYQHVLNNRVVRAAEAADRVELTTVPGGQVAGRLGAGDVRPAAEIVRALVAGAAAALREVGGHAG